ncbi:hypothetical protein NKI36_07825 [Mesorhizobium caraganae]|uniref:Glycosyltransferase RgtA/B/C/D-like domain-containing protein n=1 Tax=Mesorhizobium caraganae TaxID=483206 RepID=A0ABV1YW30_9HYPH
MDDRSAVKTDIGNKDFFGIVERPATIGLSVLIALKIVLLFALAYRSRFVMDEFGQVGYAKYLGNGLFDTVQPAKAVGFTVFSKLAILIGWDATSIMFVGRFQMALLACATIAMIYACARALGQDRQHALAIVLILLCFSNVMERIFRTISEPLALFFAVAALLVAISGNSASARRIVFAGILSGLAFLTTQKSIYFNVALGMGLLVNAFIARQYGAGIKRGAALVLGWIVPIAAYCVVFGGADPLPIVRGLIFGPVEVASRGGIEYGGLRRFVLQTLVHNAILYAFCFGGIVLGLLRIGALEERQRIALTFTAVITTLVFVHDQPWPYVFIMALPFMALWSLAVPDRNAADALPMRLARASLVIAGAISYISNVLYLRIDNPAQLALIARAEAMVKPDEFYFDGIGMLPNRREPSTLWLDQYYILKTLREGSESEAYKILSNTPPKVIIWSYRMDMIDPVIAPFIRDSYVQIAPNIRMAGRRLRSGRLDVFKVPFPGRYNLYTTNGQPADGKVEINGTPRSLPLSLEAGVSDVVLRSGPAEALLLPEGNYENLIVAGEDNAELFRGVYN